MILHPAVIALLLDSVLTASLLCYSAATGLQILTGWDPKSGSERQLLLERKTYLVTTVVAYLLGFQVIAFFLFIYTADLLHPLFTGAMCAAGTLNVNPFGYPALLVKLVNTALAGVWLVINHSDSRGYDYPLVRPKYALLVVMAPLACIEAVLMAGYFLGLKAHVITSCCGSLFGSDQGSFATGLAHLRPVPTAIAFYAIAAATLSLGLSVWRSNRGGLLLAAGSLATFCSGIVSLISFFSLYYYEMPGHHCPFCLLQGEYGGVGYLLYLLLIGGMVAGVGSGVLHPACRLPSLSRVVPALQRKLALGATLAFACYLLLVTWRMMTASFRLG